MKKLFACLLVLALCLPLAAFAEIDLSGMTFDELVALKDRINLAIWQSDTWEEVEVPQGIWKVGEDIPAGHWTIKCADPWRSTEINWSQELSESGDSLRSTDRYSFYNYVYNPNHKYYEDGDGITEYSFVAEVGDYIHIDEGSAIFSPYSGKPSFGFKAFANAQPTPEPTAAPADDELSPEVEAMKQAYYDEYSALPSGSLTPAGLQALSDAAFAADSPDGAALSDDEYASIAAYTEAMLYADLASAFGAI